MAGRILGIGGVFFRAKNAPALAQWYLDHFDIPLGLADDTEVEWKTAAGPCVFAPFDKATDYFPKDRAFMLNFRVDSLDAVVDRLASQGIEATNFHDIDDVGKFAWVHDPEGNPIELWEPTSVKG